MRRVEPGSGDDAIVIADYGSSQGKNSLAPMRLVIENLRTRSGPERPMFVFHIDQASNDFHTLFDVLSTDAGTYVRGEPNVFPCVIGRSFYEQVLPGNSVHLGWSSYAAMWLSRIPTFITGHFMPLFSTGYERLAFEQQAAQDWQTFLSLRAIELRPGGRLVIVLPGLDDSGVVGLEDLMNHANAVLAGMVAEGEIRAYERERMVIGSYPRRRCDLLQPFETDGQFRGVAVEACELVPVPDAAWAVYERNGDKEAFATKYALFFRSIFVSSLALALTEAHDGERRSRFADQFENRLKRRLAEQPTPVHCLFKFWFLRSKLPEGPVSLTTSGESENQMSRQLQYPTANPR